MIDPKSKTASEIFIPKRGKRMKAVINEPMIAPEAFQR